MRVARQTFAALGAALLLAGAATTQTHGQALVPMRGTVKSFGEEFAIRVSPSNPYRHRIGVEMRVYDHQFRPIPNARVSPARFGLGQGASRSVTAVVPFGGERVRYVRVCAESVPYRGRSSRIRTRVCGKFRALRR